MSYVKDVTGTGKELVTVLVERNGHDTVGDVESLLNPVAVVNINVNVKDAWVLLEELKDGKDDVIGVAEARRGSLLRMVQAAGPVDGNVRTAEHKVAGAIDAAACRDATKGEQPVEQRAVYLGKAVGSGAADVEAGEVGSVVLAVVRSDTAQKVDVFLGVVLFQLLSRGTARAVYFLGVTGFGKGQLWACGVDGRVEWSGCRGNQCVPFC